LKHSQRVLLPDHQFSSELPLTCHKGSSTKAHTKSPGHLDAAFTMELPMKEGSPCPPHKAIVATSHQAGRSKTWRRTIKTPSGWHTKITAVVHSRTMHKAATPYSLTLSWPNLALTLLNLVLKPMDMITKHLDGLETF
jgi:hypothetical protein